MGKKTMKVAGMRVDEIVDVCSALYEEKKPFLPFLVPLVVLVWGIERWVFSLSNWVPLAVAVWALLQYTNHQKRILIEDLNKKWKRVILSTSPTTAVEHCEWLNKMFMEFWPNYFNPRLSSRFSHMVERLLKERKPKLIEWIELQEFSLGSSPPSLGLNGTRWATSGDQRVMHMGFDWDTCDMSIMLLAKLAKPLGTARIVVNSLQIKGDLLLMPILEGRAILYSFVSTPEVRIGVAFGSGGSQIPGTELPGVSSWLVKLCSDTLDKTMVEPRRRCFSLPAEDLRKKAIGGIIHVTVVLASKMSRGSFRGSPSRKLQSSEEHFDEKDLQTFVEVELGQLTRRTSVRPGSSPKWNSTFNMVLHEETGILKFNLCNCNPGSVKYDYLASCEIKMKYVADDSTIFWAIGPDSSIIAKHAEFSGREVEMIVPFEGSNTGELAVKLVMKEWQYSDGTHNLNKYKSSSRQSVDGSSIIPSRTGRKINLTVVEGKDFTGKERSGKCNAYVKLQYGKSVQRTKASLSPNPTWNQKFEFDEIGGDEYIKLKCYSEEVFGDESIGSARVNLEGLLEGSVKDAWIPLEKVNSGELRLLIEAVKVEDEGLKSSAPHGGWIELVIIEARDLIAADLRGTSDPYVRVQYGNLKRRTKVLYKTLTPQWNQTLEFPEDESPLELHVKDHNALLPGSSIGDCVVEYQRLPPNQTADKWIPLQGVKRGEIHVRVTRRFPGVPEQPKSSSSEPEPYLSKSHQIAGQLKHMMEKFRSSIDGGSPDELSIALSEMESVADSQEEYMVQLETEQMLLLNKIKELGEEMINSSPALERRSSAAV